MPVAAGLPNYRSHSDNFVSLLSKSLEYFLDSYGIKIRLPPLDKNFPGIIVEDLNDTTTTTTTTIDENESRKYLNRAKYSRENRNLINNRTTDRRRVRAEKLIR